MTKKKVLSIAAAEVENMPRVGRPKSEYPFLVTVKVSFIDKDEWLSFVAASTPRSRVTAVLGCDK